MAVVLEVLAPLAVVGLIGWWLWLRYKLKVARAEETERMQEELSELRAYKRDTEARLQALETIATLGESRMRIPDEDTRDEEDRAPKAGG